SHVSGSLTRPVGHRLSEVAKNRENFTKVLANTQSPFDTTAATLVGSSSGSVITPQRVTLIINVAF
ncbi:MAG: hypothetical protein WCF50_15710, partial [Pseudolabrys sp.]